MPNRARSTRMFRRCRKTLPSPIRQVRLLVRLSARWLLRAKPSGGSDGPATP